MAPPNCAPLIQFADRLFFTTFPGAAPPQTQLNGTTTNVTDNPTLKRNYVGLDTPNPKYYWFTIDNSLSYLSFFEDWGPLNLANVFRACILIHELLQDKETADHRLVLYASNDPRRKANAALLMALYVMIVMRRPPWEAFNPIADVEFMPFRDAGRARPDFNLSIQDCLWGVWKAMQNGLCDMNQFSVEEYEYYEKVENGDWNWITPGFVAFASPVDNMWVQESQGGGDATPSRGSALPRRLPTPFLNCLDYFEKKNVKIVVRLNQPLYDKQVFIDRGIDHLELYFDDGTNPTDEIVRKFINVADTIISAGGVVAVHCKAGLGRTGTLIGAYLIWKYGFTANEAIAFMRILRPGSVVGPQQHFMYLKQLEWNKWSAVDEIRRQQEATDHDMIDAQATSTEPDGRTTPTKKITNNLPPVTPSRHVAASTAAVETIANPPQPRKTPRKRPTTEEEEEGYDTFGPLRPASPSKPARPAIKRSVSAKAPTSTPAPTAETGSGGEGSVTRRTRSTTAAQASGPVTTSHKSRPATGGGIPKLARSKDTNSAAITTRARAAGRPPPPKTPSRLPTLIPAKRSYVVAEVDSGAESAGGKTGSGAEKEKPPKSPAKGGRASPTAGSRTSPRRKSAGTKLKLIDDKTSNEWVNGQEASAVVVPGSKSERPLLRNVKRRRSSFSSVDIVT